jgi:glutathione synthase/RimK-type ligase-like ATP-grasp enzyme
VTAAIALVSARAAHALDEDLPPLLAAFAAAGARAEVADWDDPAVEWGRFDIALLRSAWDYTERLEEFLAWVTRTAQATTLLNPPPVVRWNCDKHYLGELAAAGAPVVTSVFAEPGARPATVLDEFLSQYACSELVVKPAVGAGSRDTRRHARGAYAEARRHIAQLLDARRAVLLQPYLSAVDAHGESALIYIGGHFSHAIRKGPLLPPGAEATRALFAPEEITPRTPDAQELAVAGRVIAATPFAALTYARVDLIRDENHAPRLLELELIEPSLFFAHASGAAARLAGTVLAATATQSGA